MSEREGEFELHVMVKLKGFGLREHRAKMIGTLRRQAELAFGDGLVYALEAIPEGHCGPTGDDMFCACGCGGDDSRCQHWQDRSLVGRQVDDWHVCCRVQGGRP